MRAPGLGVTARGGASGRACALGGRCCWRTAHFSIFDRSQGSTGENESGVLAGLFVLLLPTRRSWFLAVNSVSGNLWKVSDVQGSLELLSRH